MIDFSILETDDERIELIQNIGNLIEHGEIEPSKLNECLANYFSMNSYLVSILESVEIENNQLKTEYEIWEAEKFNEAKNKLMIDLPKSAKLSQKEIEVQIILDNKDSYTSWKNKLDLKQRQEGFYRRLCDAMKTQSQILINLAQNMRSEMYSISVEKQANKDINEECIMRRVPNRNPIK